MDATVKCDHKDDCGDNSDEAHCSKSRFSIKQLNRVSREVKNGLQVRKKFKIFTISRSIRLNK